MLDDVGLVLEGGGMRSAYTAGVLDFFLDKEMEFPLVSTASAGALIGSSFIAKQRERNYEILTTLGKNPESISYRRVLRQKDLFGMDFIFDKIPNELIPFDFDSFSQANSKFVIGTTNIDTGKPIHYDTYQTKDELLKIIRASSSLPILAPSVSFKGNNLMDGGISDPIPIKPSMDNANKKHIVVLTRNRGYVKKATKLNWLFKRAFKDHPAFAKALKERHITYNKKMKMLLEMEERGEVFIIQPEEPLVASRIERNKSKLNNLYTQGYREVEKKRSALDNFLKGTKKTIYFEKNISS